MKATVFQKGILLNTQSQSEPDIIINMSSGIFEDKRIHGVDMKAYQKAPREIESRMFSRLSSQDYKDSLMSFEQLIQNNLPNMPLSQYNNVRAALVELGNTCQDQNKHLMTWAKNLHFFPKEFIPPIRVTQNFYTGDLKPYMKENIKDATLGLTKISDKLYARNIPDKYCDYGEALNLLNEGELANLFNF